ncbi:unnamed protein product [Cylicocyclus nassatus]|uniref:Uncharacterized protein n=1 Tax=Cylicocyclus nassatus TaxID=53992 RepID=A0AA36HC46_CYLNA|nr:unnamed protein product [Cylicocyclus nassatus]
MLLMKLFMVLLAAYLCSAYSSFYSSFIDPCIARCKSEVEIYNREHPQSPRNPNCAQWCKDITEGKQYKYVDPSIMQILQ